jgi:hypothetical protein
MADHAGAFGVGGPASRRGRPGERDRQPHQRGRPATYAIYSQALRRISYRALIVCSFFISCATLDAQTGASGSAATPPASRGRIGFELAGGPAFEVATAGDRESQFAVLGVPAMTIRVTSWFDYAVEGHLAGHVTPVSGSVFGIVPIGFRLHTRGRTQVHVAGGGGVVWTDLTDVRGLNQRQNYVTQLGAGIARVGANGSGVAVEARFFHLSNLNGAPPNLGMEVFAVLVGYRFPR